jgi:HEAT repeat protein
VLDRRPQGVQTGQGSAPTSKPRREKKSQADRDEEFKASLPQRWAADRAAVLTELRNQDEADTLRLLCGLVRSGGSAGRTAAVEAIAALQIDARTSLGCLSRRLEQERDASARMALLMAMRRFGSESDSYLTSYDLQHHSDPWMRALAAEALGNTALAAGPGRGVGDSHSLAEMLRDRDATVRNAAYRSLVRAGPVAASTLAQKIYCRPDDPEQAILAARALGEIGPAARQGTAGSSIVASLRRASKCEADRALADAAQRALSSVSR